MLVLVPTQMEIERLRPYLGGVSVELCGFGPIVAAARAADLIARTSTGQVLLVGIAGTYQSRLTIGTAHEFHTIASYGVGVGSGSDHETASQLGWPQWPGESGDDAIGDTIDLPSGGSNWLVTRCSTSSTRQEADLCLARFPMAAAEDMEGFGVATACALRGVPLRVVRGNLQHCWRSGQDQLENPIGTGVGWAARQNDPRQGVNPTVAAEQEPILSQSIHLGISTCPNDTFAFHAILTDTVDRRGLDFDVELLDIDELNSRMFRGGV